MVVFPIGIKAKPSGFLMVLFEDVLIEHRNTNPTAAIRITLKFFDVITWLLWLTKSNGTF
jgi:hypothetical protein